MQFTENNSTFSLYTGLANLSVMAINPNLSELQALNPNATKTPEYSKDGKHYVFFHLGGSADVAIIVTLEPVVRMNLAKDKIQYIDDFGKTVWATSKEDALNNARISKNGFREAYVGEEQLHMVLRAWLSLNSKSPLILDKREELFKNGDFTELKSAYDSHKYSKTGDLREVRVLLGVETKETENGIRRYQRVYSKKVEPTWSNSTAYMEKSLEGSPFSFDYQNSLEFKKYEAPKVNQTPQPVKNDDLPF